MNLSEQAARVHRDAVVVDAHVDTLDRLLLAGKILTEGAPDGHVSGELLKKGGVNLLVTAMWAEQRIRPEGTVHRMLQMADLYWQTFCQDESFFPVLSRLDLKKVGSGDRIGLLLSIEGGEALAGDIALLRIYRRLGVRLITLTWSNRNQIADGIAETNGAGLSDFGRQVVANMAALGMVVDLSHISEKGFWDVIEISPNPPVCSHSNSKALCPNRRNLTDEQIKALAQKGGVIGLTMCPPFIRAEGDVDLAGYLDHIDHMAALVGTEHLGIGTDFDGIQRTPVDILNISYLPVVTEGLLRRGYAEDAVKGILGGNFMNLLSRILPE